MSILSRWEISEDQLTKIVDANPSLRGMIFGYVAEAKLHSVLEATEGIEGISKDDDHDRKNKGDRVFSYKGRQIRLEVKSLQTNSIRRTEDGTITGRAQCDASDRRKVQFEDGSELDTTCLRVGEFDILAVNLFEFNQEWKFAFALNQDLPRSTFRKYSSVQQSSLLASLVPVQWPLSNPFTGSLEEILERFITS